MKTDKFFYWFADLGNEYPKFMPLINDHFNDVISKQQSLESLERSMEITKQNILDYLEKIENLDVEKFK